MEFLAALKKAGFEDVERMDETGFNSSPKTKGILFRARKPLAKISALQLPTNDEETIKLTGCESVSTSPFSNLGDIVARALEMGAEKAKVIDGFYIPTRYANGHPEGAPFEHYGTIQSTDAIHYAGEILKFVHSQMA